MRLKQLNRVVLAAVLIAPAAHADEAAVEKALEEFIGPETVDAVRKTEYGGLYEVVLRNGHLVYTDEKGSFIVDGRIIDTVTKQDVTQERRNELASIDFSTLPLERAVKQVRGDGERIIASFEDPNCGYCKRLGAELATVDNVTLYTFLYPVLGEDSETKSRNIWCAENRAETWNAWILDGETPPVAECDTAAIDANIELGQQLRIEGTPTLFFADGRRVGGFMRAPQIEEVFDEVEAEAAPKP